jgi:hypothetical protein
LRRGYEEPDWADADQLLPPFGRLVETEGTLGALERGRIGGIPIRPLRGPTLEWRRLL